jgi:hypothetical protein
MRSKGMKIKALLLGLRGLHVNVFFAFGRVSHYEPFARAHTYSEMSGTSLNGGGLKI